MPEHFRAFIVVIVLTVTVLAVIRKPASEFIGPETFSRWRAAWIILTVAVFFINNFWIFLGVAALIVLVVAAREPARPALYLLLLFVAPQVSHSIPGFAGIHRLFDITPQALLAILLLLPVFLSRSHMSRQPGAPRLPDLLLFLYFALTVALTLRQTTFTDAMRSGFMMLLFMLLPYAVFSRWPRSLGDMRLLAAAFVMPLFVLAAIGFFEMIWGWHVYTAQTVNWGGGFRSYMGRAGGLRAEASVGGGPIAFGFVFMVGAGLLLLVLGTGSTAKSRAAALAGLGAGLVSSLSRGPYVGAAVLALTFLATGRGAFKSLLKLGLAAVVVFTLLLVTPVGDRLIAMIPFVGDIDEQNISYRQRLFENGWIVFQRNPLLGSVDYLEAPEMQELAYWNGLIDIVNTYLGIALETGLVGLSLFCGFFLSVLFGLWRAVKALPEEEAELKLAGRALLATLAAILVTIATVSSVGPIPILYWTVAGLGVAQTSIIRRRVGVLEQQRDQARPRRANLAPSNPAPVSPVRVGPAPLSALRPGGVVLKTPRRSGK